MGSRSPHGISFIPSSPSDIVATTIGPERRNMRLYRSIGHPARWIAFTSQAGWVAFPAEEGGWQKRRAARGLDPIELREVPVQLASNTGILGGIAMTEDSGSPLREAA